MTHILRAHSPADFLAMVPALAGYTARESVIVVLFRGTRTAGAFRLDLPSDASTRAVRRTVEGILSILARTREIDRIAPVIYTDATFAEERGIPWLGLARRLRERLQGTGIALNGLYCVAADGWGDYLSGRHQAVGHPLHEIVESPLTAEASTALAAPLDDVHRLGRLPEADPALTGALSEALAPFLSDPGTVPLEQILDALAHRVQSLGRFGETDAVSWVELCAEWDGTPPAEVLAHLLVLAQAPADRDAMMMQFAFGRIVGEALHDVNSDMTARATEAGLSMDDLVLRDIAEGRSRLDDEVLGLLWGRGALRPSVERVQHAITLLSTATANVPDFLRPAPLCMLAWLHWTLGLGSAAGALVDLALDIDPDYGMAQVLMTMLSQGRIPDWAFVPERSDT